MRICGWIVLVCLLNVTSAEAGLSKQDIEAVGRFLRLDFASLPADQKKEPLTTSFLVKSGEGTFEISDDESKFCKEHFGVNVPSCKYREIIVINEVSGLGAVVRYAYMSADRQIYWRDRGHSLLEFEPRPELGNTGVLRLLLHSVEDIQDLVRGCQDGELPSRWKPSDAEVTYYKATIRVVDVLASRRPGPDVSKKAESK